MNSVHILTALRFTLILFFHLSLVLGSGLFRYSGNFSCFPHLLLEDIVFPNLVTLILAEESPVYECVAR
jgi:hypothetical protein